MSFLFLWNFLNAIGGLINNQQTEDWDKKMKIENYKWETEMGKILYRYMDIQ